MCTLQHKTANSQTAPHGTTFQGQDTTHIIGIELFTIFPLQTKLDAVLKYSMAV
jgi:hypothetical protein